MTQSSPTRKAISGASIAVPFFAILGVVIPGLLILQCEAGDCEPFSSEGTEDRISQTQDNAEAVGAAQQLFYSVQVGEDDMQLIEALRLHAHCDRISGEAEDDRCAEAPEEDEIVEAVEDFRPYPRDVRDSIMDLLPFVDGMGFHLSMSRDGVDMIEAAHNIDVDEDEADDEAEDADVEEDEDTDDGADDEDADGTEDLESAVSGDTSTFVVVEPIPGGDHIRVRFEIERGRIAMGVIE